MYVILLALGAIMGAAAIASIALGVPAGMPGVGIALLSAAFTALVGGLMLMSLAATNRQLRRIAQSLEGQPAPRAAAESPKPAPVETGPVGQAPAPAGYPAEAEPPAQIAESVAAIPTTDGKIEPGAMPVSNDTAPAARGADIPPPAPDRTFDAVWSAAAPVQPAPQVAAEPKAAPIPDGVKIFKSGVIDGMAYTLYTDGSIEAVLAQGTVKFASVEELRSYLAERE